MKTYHKIHHKTFEKKFMKHPCQHPDRHPDCRFCRMIKDKDNILFENSHVIVVFGRPHHKGHLVILTRAHEENLMLLHEKTLDNLFESAVKVCRALYKAIKFDRLNIEYLDNWDPHIHWNIYPRFKTDKDWGQPPHLPKKKEKFKKQYMDWKEIKVFRKEMGKFAETTMRRIRK
ncbi:HIT family protein [Candidatus Woesearchaeota archaeon]|nr:HIT family protein [Candidatus Woesearchaeota archaeon]